MRRLFAGRGRLGSIGCTAASAVALVVVAAWVGVAPTGAAATSPAPPPRAPLDTSWTTAEGSWAVVAMGRFGEPLNTFWQALFRPVGGAPWTVVTPPGVATNGGLVGYVDPAGTAAIGVEPSKYLHYSPVARTPDGGKQWSPGVLPSALLAVPDAVTIEPSGTLLALVERDGGELLASGSSLTRWSTVVTTRGLASSPAGRRCGRLTLEAVASSGGSAELGTSCTTRGTVGIFVQVGGTWEDVGPVLSGELAHDAVTVLRLVGGSTGTAALVEAAHGRVSTLVAMWRHGTGAWTVSAGTRLTDDLLATGVGPTDDMVVLTGRGHTARAVTMASIGHAWSLLPAPPARTGVVVDTASGFEALAVTGSSLTDWQLDPTTGRWQRSQTARVPIEYGSST